MTKKKNVDVIPDERVLDYFFSLSGLWDSELDDDLSDSDGLLDEVMIAFTYHEQANERICQVCWQQLE